MAREEKKVVKVAKEEMKAAMTPVATRVEPTKVVTKVVETRIRLANHGVPKSIGVEQKHETGLVQGVFSRRTIASS